MPGVHKVDLVSQDVVAAHLGVSTQAISNWYARGLEGMPVASLVQHKAGREPLKVWRRAQLEVWSKWFAKRNSQTRTPGGSKP